MSSSSSHAAELIMQRDSSATTSLLRIARAFSRSRVIEMRCANSAEATETGVPDWLAKARAMALNVSLPAGPQELHWG